MATVPSGAVSEHLQSLFRFGTTGGLSDGELLERFLDQSDDLGQAAFRVLIERHAPMVLRLCRDVLRDWHEAEDAAQATFLVLAGKAGSIRKRDSIASWLFGVACRVAGQARAKAARRRVYEKRSAKSIAQADLSVPWLELYEEIDRLPEKWRAPLVLCYLKGHSQEEAATRLGCPVRTLQRRLSEGQDRLRMRLTRRGLLPSVGLAATSNYSRGASIIVPAAWLETTVRAALANVKHATTVGVVSAGAMELTREVLRLMMLQKLALASATLLAAGLIAWGASAALVSLPEEPSQKSAARPNSPLKQKAETAVPQTGPNSLETPGKVTIRGRVLAPDGQPVPGAKIYRTSMYVSGLFSAPESATSGPDGRFEFAVGENERRQQPTVVAATAANYGVAWAEVPPEGRSDNLTLQLVDDQPITGQIVDLEGKPAPGATLQVLSVRAAAGEDLGPWLEAAKAKKGLSDQLEWQYLPRVTIAPAPKFTADAEGRFRLIGIGRNRLVVAQLDGTTIASQRLHILTRPGEALTVVRFEFPTKLTMTTTYYGASFRHAAAPTKPIVGVVHDKDTKKPLAGITIASQRLANDPIGGNDMVRTTTDAQGRYRLVGMPKGEGNRIQVVPGNDQPYLISYADVPDSPGLDPVTADFELKRGIWIEGKVTDKVNGKPVVGEMSYHAQADNPNQSVYGYATDPNPRATVHEDGSYSVAGMPGPGMVVVRFVDGYLRAHERDDEFGTKEISIPTVPLPTMNYTAMARIDPARGVETVTRDVTLDPGWTFTGTLLGPDGQPLAGAWGIGLDSREDPWERQETMMTAQFKVRRFNPHHPRPLLFQHPHKGLVGVGQPPKNQGDSITVQLHPGATVTGRLVDAVGRARAGVEMVVWRSHKELAQPGDFRYFPPRPKKTDREGRFRIACLLPGYEFSLYDGKGILPLGEGLRSGETKDLGDVKIGDG
jgi:RNA polymerase sigma factor (sigma-70 family)